MVAVGAPFIVIANDEDKRLVPLKFPAVTVRVPPVAATPKFNVFRGSVVVPESVVPPPV